MTQESQTLKLKSGDVVLIATDGVTDAVGKEDDRIGVEKIYDFLKEHSKNLNGSIIQSLKKRFESHLTENPENDDITIITIKII